MMFSREFLDGIEAAHKSWPPQVFEHLKKCQFTTGVLFSNSLRDAWQMRRAGVKELYGRAARCRGFLMKRTFAFPKWKKGILNESHHTNEYLEIVEAMGAIRPEPLMPELDSKLTMGQLSLKMQSFCQHPKLLLMAPGAAYGAAKAGIKATVLARGAYSDIADYSKALVDELKRSEIELVVLAGFLTIIDEQVYNAYPNKILNVHPALIPSFCGKGYYGLRVHEAALEKGVKVSGATVHIVTPECDAGPIVLQRAVEVRDDDTPETLQLRIMQEAEWKILPEAVRLFSDRRVTVKDNKVYIN